MTGRKNERLGLMSHKKKKKFKSITGIKINIQSQGEKTKGKDLKFNELNYDFIKKFERYHLAKGNGYNSLSTYLRAIKAIYNKGIKAGLIEREAFPFTHYSIKQVPTEKRALSIEDIRKVMNLKLPKDMVLFRYRNYFICSFLLYGMNFTDMAYLKVANIINGRIKFRRKKTAKLYDI